MTVRSSTLKERYSPTIIVGGTGMGKTNLITTFYLQDESDGFSKEKENDCNRANASGNGGQGKDEEPHLKG